MIGEVLVKLLVAAVLGGAIGLERESHGRPAGLRTNILVSVGAALVVIVAKATAGADLNHVIAGVVTGIGFLGAGAIIKMGNLVRGLTTAACIWLVAVLGLTVGQGLYAIAGLTAAIAMFVLVVMDRASRVIPSVAYNTVTVTTDREDFPAISNTCRSRIEASGVRVLAAEVKGKAGGVTDLIYHVRVRGQVETEKLIRELLSLPGITAASWEDFRG